jgi:O-antigen/teichoic acid export membrane protein
MIVPVSVTLFPKLSQYWTNGAKELRTDMLLSGIRIATPLALLMFGVSWMCGKEALGAVIGDRFARAAPFMLILLATLCFRSLSMFFANALVAGGRQKQHMYVTALVVTVNLVMSILMIRSFGAYGAAWTVFAAFALELLGFFLMVRNSIRVKTLAASILRIVGSWSAACLAGWLFSKIVPIYTITPYIAGTIFSVSFLGLLYWYEQLPLTDHAI